MAKRKRVVKKKAAPKTKTPRVVLTRAREFILEVIGGTDGLDRVVYKIFTQALKGSFKHQELLLNYILGKPVEKLKLEQFGGATAPAAPVVKIIADHLRLDRLKSDAEATPVISADRIKEMEDILNKEI